MSAANRLKTFCTSFVFNARLIHARLKKGTVRFKITDLDGFYKQLDQADIPYVILRWLDDVPMTFEMEQRNEHDVDHLIADHQIKTILKIAAPVPVERSVIFILHRVSQEQLTMVCPITCHSMLNEY